MDDRRFDTLARALGGASTRRGAIGALAALLAGGAALDADARRGRGGKDRDDAKAAGKRRNKKRCNPECTGNFSCVKGQCVCEQVICGTACCDDGQVCQRGRCVGQGTVFCHDLAETCGDGAPCCAGLQCGSGYGGGPVACWPEPGGDCERNEECAYGQHCENGACVYDPPPPPVPTCPAGQTDCGGNCADLQTDPDNCGACGAGCGPNGGCEAGACLPPCTVCASGCQYTKIEDAIAAAQANDTILVGAGTYAPAPNVTNGNYLTMDKPLTLKRCRAQDTVTISCPQETTSNGYAGCLYMTHGTGTTIVDGISLAGPNADLRPRYGMQLFANGTVVLRNTTVSGFTYAVSTLALNLVIEAGNTFVGQTATSGASGSAGLFRSGTAGITCNATATFTTMTRADCIPNNPSVFTGCGCGTFSN